MASDRPVIMHVIHILCSGGLENGLVNIINRMPPDRYDHHIVCLTHATNFANRVQNPSVSVHQLHKREGHDFRMYRRFLALVGSLKPDIIHTRNFGTLEMQLLGLRRWRAARVHGEHGRDMFDLHGDHKGYNRFRRFMSRFIDRYVTVSKDLQQWLIDTVGIDASKITQIYNGVDQQRFQPLREKRRERFPDPLRGTDTVLFGTVGRLAAVKSQKTLVDAFADLCELRPEQRERLGLVLVGEGPMQDELEALVARRGIADRCWFAGDRDDVDRLLPELDVFVLPSLNEGISNTVLEAMASGLPVIATRVGGNPELVIDGENGFLIPVEDVDGLAVRMDELLRDSDLRQRMGSAGRSRIEDRFNWDHTVRAYTAIYESLLERRR